MAPFSAYEPTIPRIALTLEMSAFKLFMVANLRLVDNT